MQVCDYEALSPEQLRLIRAASKSGGRLTIAVRSDTQGRAVRTKTERFWDPDDPSTAARYVQAVTELKKQLLLREVDQAGQHELTNLGWLLSRKIESI
jgi:hypothetical protein